MGTFIRWIVRAALVAVLVVSLGAGGHDTAAAGTTTTTALSVQERQVLDWAMALFDEAGLDLPAIDVVGHDGNEPCGGGAGFHTGDGQRSTLHICGEHRRKFDEVLFLHELAHAWDVASLDDEHRAAFAELRGVEQWWDDGVHDWDERGAEHAAEIIAWGLRDSPMQVITLDDVGCDALELGYITLTGRPPLHGYRDLCG